MKIREIDALRGPNYWSIRRHKLIVMVLDLEETEYTPTHKIEGFFDVCKVKGLSGDQGVVIPKSNINNLVLKEEIVQAIKAGTFQVYAVETLNQGLEILTGMPAGEPDENGGYQNGTINYAITKKLERFSDKAQELARKGQWQPQTNL